MSRNGFLIIAVIVLFVIGYYMYRYYAKSSMEPIQSGGDVAQIMLFYTDWCPHCISAKPEWKRFKEQYEGQTVNGYKLYFVEVNCTKETSENEKLMAKYGVDGYPTIKYVQGNKVISFDAKPTYDNLVQFVQSV